MRSANSFSRSQHPEIFPTYYQYACLASLLCQETQALDTVKLRHIEIQNHCRRVKLTDERAKFIRISRDLDRRSDKEQDAESVLQHLQTFCHRVAEGLDNMSFEERRQLLRLVVDRITVENETVRIETVIPGPNDSGQLRTRRGELVEPHRAVFG